MSPYRMERVESAVRVVIALNESLNQHDVPGMMARLSDDCVFESIQPAPDGYVYTGKAAITQFCQDFFLKSPQAHIKIEEIFGLGVRCIMRWRYDWVDTSGNNGHVRGVDIYRVQAGMIREWLSYAKG